MDKFIPDGIYIYIYIFNRENNVPSWLPPQWLCGNSSTWGHDAHHVHHVSKCMSCHKYIVVITGRVHCFHDCTYILCPSCFCEIWALCVSWIISDNLYKYMHYINICTNILYIYIYTFIYKHIYVYTYIYIYIQFIYMHTYIYIYIYIYIIWKVYCV